MTSEVNVFVRVDQEDKEEIANVIVTLDEIKDVISSSVSSCDATEIIKNCIELLNGILDGDPVY